MKKASYPQDTTLERLREQVADDVERMQYSEKENHTMKEPEKAAYHSGVDENANAKPSAETQHVFRKPKASRTD